MVKSIYVLLLSVILVSVGSAQQDSSNRILTAKEFLDQMSQKYGTFKDVKASIAVSEERQKQQGTIFIKSPNKFRINYTNPNGQIMNNNGTDFHLYIPSQNVVLHQKKRTQEGAAAFASGGGLKLLSSNYFVSYLDKPEYVRYSEDDSTQVMKIKLVWRSPTQNFREIIMSVNKDNMVHSVDAVTYNRTAVSIKFSNYVINEGIPDSRFDYDPPATAHVVDKFLFDEEEALDE